MKARGTTLADLLEQLQELRDRLRKPSGPDVPGDLYSIGYFIATRDRAEDIDRIIREATR